MKKWIDKSLLSLDTEEGKLSLFQLSLPIFINSISILLISVVQTVVATSYLEGFFVIPINIAATGVGFLHTIVMLVGTGASILLSIYLGKEDGDASRKIVGTALIMSLAFSAVVALLGFVLSEPLLDFMGLSKPEYSIYRSYALTIFRIRMLDLLIWSVGNVALSCLRCYGYAKVGLVAGITSNLVNLLSVLLALFVIQVPKEAVAPVLASIAVVSSSIFTLIGVGWLFVRKIPVEKRFSVKWCKKIFRIGIPASVSQIFYSLSQIVTTSICTLLTPAAYLAKTYISQITQFTYKFGYSIGQANSIMVGRLCGMNELSVADRMHRQNLKIVLACNSSLSLLCIIFGRLLLRIFSADESILAFSLIFVIDLAVEFGRGMNHVGEYGLNATGDVKFTTIVSVLSCWVFSVGLSYLFVVVFNFNLFGMWSAFAIDELFRGITYYVRWRKQGWKKGLKSITSDEPEKASE